MIEWATAALETAANQSILPYAIIKLPTVPKLTTFIAVFLVPFIPAYLKLILSIFQSMTFVWAVCPELLSMHYHVATYSAPRVFNLTGKEEVKTRMTSVNAL
jgi:hypothetical protein